MVNETIFKRYEGNPIIKPEDVPGANSIFNSAVVKFGKSYAGVFRVDSTRLLSELHTGFSDDAIN
ncbi:MAG: glycosidase, partial [Candidatus Firestonebacteria bacterium]